MSVRIRIPDLPPALTPMVQPFERTTQDSILQPPPLIELSPFDASAFPAWKDADAEPSMTSSLRRSLWYRSKAFFGYASRDGEQLDRRTFVREMWFVFVATTQVRDSTSSCSCCGSKCRPTASVTVRADRCVDRVRDLEQGPSGPERVQRVRRLWSP